MDSSGNGALATAAGDSGSPSIAAIGGACSPMLSASIGWLSSADTAGNGSLRRAASEIDLVGRSLALFGAVAAMAAAAALAPMIVLVIVVAAALFFKQRLPVRDRNLIIVRMDFGEGQKAVAVAAVIDEGRLQRGFNARDFGEVDIAAKRFAAGGFEIEFFDAVTA